MFYYYIDIISSPICTSVLLRFLIDFSLDFKDNFFDFFSGTDFFVQLVINSLICSTRCQAKTLRGFLPNRQIELFGSRPD